MRGSYKARGQRGPHRASLDLTAAILASGVEPHSRIGRDCHLWGERVLGAVAAWRHRQMRRREADQAVFS